MTACDTGQDKWTAYRRVCVCAGGGGGVAWRCWSRSWLLNRVAHYISSYAEDFSSIEPLMYPMRRAWSYPACFSIRIQSDDSETDIFIYFIIIFIFLFFGHAFSMSECICGKSGKEAWLIENLNQCAWFVELEQACICACVYANEGIWDCFMHDYVCVCVRPCVCVWVAEAQRTWFALSCGVSVRVAWPLPSALLHGTAANERCHCMTAARPLFRTDDSSNTRACMRRQMCGWRRCRRRGGEVRAYLHTSMQICKLRQKLATVGT